MQEVDLPLGQHTERRLDGTLVPARRDHICAQIVENRAAPRSSLSGPVGEVEVRMVVRVRPLRDLAGGKAS